jgi:hypothetical protein
MARFRKTKRSSSIIGSGTTAWADEYVVLFALTSLTRWQVVSFFIEQ